MNTNNPAAPPPRHPASLAWDAWKESDEGRRCLAPGGIGVPEQFAGYLENRVERAFLAGYDARGRRG